MAATNPAAGNRLIDARNRALLGDGGGPLIEAPDFPLERSAGQSSNTRIRAACTRLDSIIGPIRPFRKGLIMTCRKCQHGTAKRFGFTKNKSQRYRCHDCGATFTDSPQKPLGSHTTDLDRAAQAFTLLTEGMSVRAVSRVTGLHKNTILSLIETAAEKCRTIFDRHVQNVTPRYVQADEIWTFVHTKEKRVNVDDPVRCV